MDDRWANIDLVFRNGLKDYEVLPPPEVWDKIKPSLKARSKAFILFRVAAAVTVMATIGFLAYEWSRNAPQPATGSYASFDISTGSPVTRIESEPSFNPTPDVKIASALSFVSPPVKVEEKTQIIEKEQDISTETSAPVPANILSASSFYTGNKQVLSRLGSSQKKTLDMPVMTPQELILFSPVKNEQRWSIAAMASPTYYSQFSSGSALSKELASSEQGRISYSGGLAVSYKINKRISVQTGLYYSSLGQKLEGVSSFSGFQPFSNTKGDHNFEVLTTSGSVYATNPDVFLAGSDQNQKILTAYTNDVFDPKKASLTYLSNSLVQSISYLELPVVVKYKVIDRAIDFNLIGGLSYSLLVNNLTYAKVNGNKYPVGDTRGLNPLTLSSSLGMGMEYNVSKKISLNFEPTFRYYLNPFSIPSSLNNHPYSFGIYSGFSYKF